MKCVETIPKSLKPQNCLTTTKERVTLREVKGRKRKKMRRVVPKTWKMRMRTTRPTVSSMTRTLLT